MQTDNQNAFFDELCNKHFHMVYKYCFRLVNREHALVDFVQECTQETFLQARLHIDKLKKHPNVEGWLLVTARNLIHRSFRGMYARKQREISLDDHVEENPTLHRTEWEVLMESLVDVDQLSSVVLEELRAEEHTLYMDYYINRISVHDLSVKHRITPSAVTSRIHRLKSKIKKHVRKHIEPSSLVK